MNELDQLSHLREDIPAISTRTQARGRERLVALMAPANRQARRPTRLRIAVVAGVGVLAASAALSAPVLFRGETAGQAARDGIGSASAPESPLAADLAAFSVKVANDDEVVVTLRRVDELFQPAALQQALAAAGVSAVVKVGTCNWSNIPDNGQAPDYGQAVSITPNRPPAPFTFVIKPSAIPTKTRIVLDIAQPWSPDEPTGPYAPKPQMGGEMAANGHDGGMAEVWGIGGGGYISWGLVLGGDPVTC